MRLFLKHFRWKHLVQKRQSIKIINKDKTIITKSKSIYSHWIFIAMSVEIVVGSVCILFGWFSSVFWTISIIITIVIIVYNIRKNVREGMSILLKWCLTFSEFVFPM